ncbi:MAG TPA: UDP-glucose--hexose-1-phosphate uridylyltransferase [Patescibacteria group bacterium]|nr:UDP-glucose--hexose-1-phosphate uridylyltransferase [Patescibacteria group bacterium]
MTPRLLPGPHRRHDPLRDAWVLVSGGRATRPWRGQLELPTPVAPPAYDPGCALCPGNVRASGARNPTYSGTFVFANDFPALVDQPAVAEGPQATADDLFRAEPAAGVARVLCFSERHDLSLGALPLEGIRGVVDLWAGQAAKLGEAHRWVQVFENRGEAMGASNPHPHGQVWAGSALPVEAAREDATQLAWLQRTRRRLLIDVVSRERGGPRAVAEAPGWLALVPYWATWPYELLLLPEVPVARLADLDEGQRDGLAEALRDMLGRLDRLFDRPFPYSMGWHQAPAGPDPGDVGHWQLHAHVYPPLLRADARKFMVGYELLAEPQRDLTPEEAAAALRAVAPRS